MKKVVSISLGQSLRDHEFTAEFLGETFQIRRIGTDGDVKKMMELYKSLDSEVDAFGMGGGDIYLRPGNRTYILQEPYKWSKAAPTKPVCDGAFLKAVLEPRVINQSFDKGYLNKGMKVCVMTAVDRYFLAKAFADRGCKYVLGDMPFSLGIPIGIHSLGTIRFIGAMLLPIITRLPYNWFYPLGEKQDKIGEKKNRFFRWADVIAGDLHYIRKNLDVDMTGKIVCTNTTTKKNIEEFKSRGVKKVITFTPDMNGRTFGANVMEAMVASIIGKHPRQTSVEEYNQILDKLNFKPNVINITEDK